MKFSGEEIRSMMGVVVFVWSCILVIIAITVIDIVDGRAPLVLIFVVGAWLVLWLRGRFAVRRAAREEADKEK